LVQPASDSPEDLEAAEFLYQCQQDTSHGWEDFVAELLSFLPYGWSYFEVVYKIRGGPTETDPKFRSKFNDRRVGWRKFALRSQDTLHRWEFDSDGGVKGMWQQPIGDAMATKPQIVFIPIEKAVLFRTTSAKNNPEGRSVLRSAYRSWYFQKRIQEIESVGLERDLAGLPVMRVPIELLETGRTAEQTATYNYLRDIVTRVRRDEQEGLMLPLAYDENSNELFKFELLTSGGKRQFDTGAIVQRYSQEIAMSILSDWLLLGHESVGSFALSSDKTELFAVALGSWLDSIQETLNRHVVPRLFQLNTFPIDRYPEFRHGDIESPNLAELADFVQKLSAAGAPLFPDIELENKMRQLADLPEVDPAERENMLAQQQQDQMMQMMMGGQPNGNGGGAGPPQQMVKAALEELNDLYPT
jgi:hypothetical protein